MGCYAHSSRPTIVLKWWGSREFWVKHENVGLTLHPVQAQIYKLQLKRGLVWLVVVRHFDPKVTTLWKEYNISFGFEDFCVPQYSSLIQRAPCFTEAQYHYSITTSYFASCEHVTGTLL